MFGLTKWQILSKTFFILLPIYCGFKYYIQRRREAEEVRLLDQFMDRHNCSVFYSKSSMCGWPDEDEKDLYAPILYYIDTAVNSIDVAVMMLHTERIIDALIRACERGVAVRVLIDFNYNKPKDLKNLDKAGAELRYYIYPEPGVTSILHNKYMVKDFYDGKGFLYCGSLNFSPVGIQTNYEHIVFTNNSKVVGDFHNNFKEIWNFVDKTEYTVHVQMIKNPKK